MQLSGSTPPTTASLGGEQPGGKHFICVSDRDRCSRYQVDLDGVPFDVLPIDDTSVYNQLIDDLYLDKTKMKKMDSAEQLDAIALGAAEYEQKYESISFDQGPARL